MLSHSFCCHSFGRLFQVATWRCCSRNGGRSQRRRMRCKQLALLQACDCLHPFHVGVGHLVRTVAPASSLLALLHRDFFVVGSRVLPHLRFSKETFLRQFTLKQKPICTHYVKVVREVATSRYVISDEYPSCECKTPLTFVQRSYMSYPTLVSI